MPDPAESVIFQVEHREFQGQYRNQKSQVHVEFKNLEYEQYRAN